MTGLRPTTDQQTPTLTVHDPERATPPVDARVGSRTQFDDPKLEYRRLFSELLGTFLLVLVAAGGGILHAKGQISLAAAVVAPGLMVMAVILFMGAVSGAHLNPVVSLAFAMRGDFPWRRVPRLHRRAASRCDAGVPVPARGVRQRRASRGTLPGHGYDDWQALLMEIVLTAGLLSVILGTASAAQNVGHDRRAWRRRLHRAGRAVVGAGERHLDEPGALLRPGAGQRRLDRLLGLCRRPLVGAAIAVGCALILRGRGGDPISTPPARRAHARASTREGHQLSAKIDKKPRPRCRPPPRYRPDPKRR